MPIQPITTQKTDKYLRRIIFLVIAVIIFTLLFSPPLLAQQAGESENTYPPAGWNLIPEDSLSTNNGSWVMSPSCQLAGGIYQISANHYCLDKNVDLSNFAFEVIVKEHNISEENLYFHYDDDGTGYDFSVDQQGNYSFYVNEQGKDSKDLADGTSTAIHPGSDQPNLIAVVARRNAFDLYVNHQFVTTVVDEKKTFDHGYIGLGVVAPDNSSGKASFSDLRVWAPLAVKPS